MVIKATDFILGRTLNVECVTSLHAYNIHTYMHRCMCTHAYIYAYIHACAHTYIHTYVQLHAHIVTCVHPSSHVPSLIECSITLVFMLPLEIIIWYGWRCAVQLNKVRNGVLIQYLMHQMSHSLCIVHSSSPYCLIENQSLQSGSTTLVKPAVVSRVALCFIYPSHASILVGSTRNFT